MEAESKVFCKEKLCQTLIFKVYRTEETKMPDNDEKHWCQPENVERLKQRALWLKELMVEDPPEAWKPTKADKLFLKGLGIKA